MARTFTEQTILNNGIISSYYSESNGMDHDDQSGDEEHDDRGPILPDPDIDYSPDEDVYYTSDSGSDVTVVADRPSIPDDRDYEQNNGENNGDYCVLSPNAVTI